MAINDCSLVIDEIYEFSAPKFFDFINGETEADVSLAEMWFQTALSYAPSPFMPRIKTGRSESIQVSLCDFSNAEDLTKVDEKSDYTNGSTVKEETKLVDDSTRIQSSPVTLEPTKEEENYPSKEEIRVNFVKESVSYGKENKSPLSQAKQVKPTESQVKGLKPISASDKTLRNTTRASEFVQENHAIKRQLDEGRSRQILNVVPQNLPHKSKPGLGSGLSNLFSSTSTKATHIEDRKILNVVPQNLPHKSKPGLGRGRSNLFSSTSTKTTHKEDRKLYVREPSAPFVSTAELVKRFQSNTRDTWPHFKNSSVSHDDAASLLQKKSKLTLTRPMGPDFETANRVRSYKVKSFAELEEEMMVNIPKFKARPVNKKILEAPTLPSLPRTTPHLPEFQEFHLKTSERANQHAETSAVVSSTESSHQNHWNPHKLTKPRTPRLETMLRSRPPKVKTSQDLEQEELEKISKFKARPLNKKIFESKGGLGIYCNSKRQHNPHRKPVKHGTTIFTINCGVERGVYIVVDGLGRSWIENHDGSQKPKDEICGRNEKKAFFLGDNYMVAAVAGSNAWFDPIIHYLTLKIRQDKKLPKHKWLTPEQCARYTHNYLKNKNNKPNRNKYLMTDEEFIETSLMKCDIIFAAYIPHPHTGESVPSVFSANNIEILEVVQHKQITGKKGCAVPSFAAFGSGGEYAEKVLEKYRHQFGHDILTSRDVEIICLKAMKEAVLQDPENTGGILSVFHIQWDTITDFNIDSNIVEAKINNLEQKNCEEKKRTKKLEEKRKKSNDEGRRMCKKRKNKSR